MDLFWRKNGVFSVWILKDGIPVGIFVRDRFSGFPIPDG
jgi:hypothetical protein